MMEKSKSIDIFHHQNNIFISAKYEIKAIDLQKYLMQKFASDVLQFPKCTTFYFITRITLLMSIWKFYDKL